MVTVLVPTCEGYGKRTWTTSLVEENIASTLAILGAAIIAKAATTAMRMKVIESGHRLAVLYVLIILLNGAVIHQVMCR